MSIRADKDEYTDEEIEEFCYAYETDTFYSNFVHKEAVIIRQLLDQVKQLKSQLPATMQNCTFEVKACKIGHVWLTAKNWVEHGCPTCEQNRLEQTILNLQDDIVKLKS